MNNATKPFNAMIASNQWANRPNDERYWDLNELEEATGRMAAAARLADVDAKDLRVTVDEADPKGLRLAGREVSASISHYAFGQIARRASFPPAPLRTLPPYLTAEVLNHKLDEVAFSDEKVRLLVHENGGYLVRSLASTKFTPILNHDIVTKLRPLAEAGGWGPPPGWVPYHGTDIPEERLRIATEEDAARSIRVRPGDTIAPSGLYASAEDMFIFLVNPDKVLRDGSAEGLTRGFIVQNAEVAGKLSFRVFAFFMRGVCGNHIIWSPTGITEIRVPHIGRADERAFDKLSIQVRRYADAGAAEAESAIQAARTREIAGTKEEVIETIFKNSGLTREQTEESYRLAEQVESDTDNPRSHWGFAQGVTRLSQKAPNADDRTDLDREAGKIITMAF